MVCAASVQLQWDEATGLPCNPRRTLYVYSMLLTFCSSFTTVCRKHFDRRDALLPHQEDQYSVQWKWELETKHTYPMKKPNVWTKPLCSVFKVTTQLQPVITTATAAAAAAAAATLSSIYFRHNNFLITLLFVSLRYRCINLFFSDPYGFCSHNCILNFEV